MLVMGFKISQKALKNLLMVYKAPSLPSYIILAPLALVVL